MTSLLASDPATRSVPPGSWNDVTAADCSSELELRALVSRWIGADPAMALHGGGNTSLKSHWRDGRPCLHVKGSGADLAEVTVRDFATVDLTGARAVLDAGTDLDNEALAQALAPLMLEATSPRPSIETLMHAALPHRHVEHTHADDVLAVINTSDGGRLAREVFGDVAPLVPFRHSGFALAAACADVWRRQHSDHTIGLLLAFHGVVAFGDSARQSFERLYRLAGMAREYLREQDAWDLPRAEPPARTWPQALRLLALRQALSREAGFPMVLHVDDSPECLAFCQRPDLAIIALQGPPTPQHAVFTKRLPALGLDAACYASAYRRHVEADGAGLEAGRIPDPAPRVLLEPSIGVIAASVDAHHARMTAQVYRHDLEIISRASGHDRYISLQPEAILAAEVHYGGFDRALLRRRSGDLPLLGCIVGLAPGHLPMLAPALARKGADAVPLPADQDASLALAWSHGGLDVCVLAPGSTGLHSAVEAMLAASPGGGLVLTRAPGTQQDTLLADLVHAWSAATGVHPT
jgi:rhamnose utilization protein RhaD (predicted bifunctional aldolase and dehydrogenase)